MAIQLIPLVIAIVGGAATVGAGAYVYKNYTDTQQNQPPAALMQPTPEVAKKPQAEPQIVKEPEIKIVETPLPQFHLLQVEKDGSVLIAGSAPANSKVEILHLENAIITTKAAVNGDFAAVLDNPLKPGTYELFIRAIDKNGKSFRSAQAGLIVIPERGGELLAMVSEPGAPSKLIQVPQAKPEPKPVVKIEQAPKPVAIIEPAPKPVAKSTINIVPSPRPVAKAKPIPKPVVEKQPELAPKLVAKVEAPPAPKPVVKINPKPEPVVIKPVFLGAVEVEGTKIFIAGSGEPGRVVNVYIDGVFIGKTRVNRNGSFLLEANSKLDFGEHTVRADMLEIASATVVARAEVPLIHDAPPQSIVVASTPEIAPIKPVQQAKIAAPVKVIQPASEKTRKLAIVEKAQPAPKPKPVVATKPRRVIRTGSSVIIRKGDNLWRISRRILGRGIRYSTIYQANKDQIKNPSLIFPGQIFGVPEKMVGFDENEKG